MNNQEAHKHKNDRHLWVLPKSMDCTPAPMSWTEVAPLSYSQAYDGAKIYKRSMVQKKYTVPKTTLSLTAHIIHAAYSYGDSPTFFIDILAETEKERAKKARRITPRLTAELRRLDNIGKIPRFEKLRARYYNKMHEA